jgi:signal peptidase I
VLWVTALPAALTALVLKYLVPPIGSDLPGVVTNLGHRHGLLFGVALFLLFSALTHYWWRLPDPPPEPRRRMAIARWVAMILAFAGAALALRTYVVQPYRVLSASMLPTLEPDDLVAGRKGAYSPSSGRLPARGEVVAFRGASVAAGPGGLKWPDVLVKRVIGWPGDLVGMRGGVPVINGWLVPWCDAGEYLYVLPDAAGRGLHGRLRVEFLDDRAYLTVQTPGAPFEGTYRVKPGEVFVLGDNRGGSMDSRAYDGGRGGGVPLEAIDARVQWFLLGTHRSGSTDLDRLLRPVDALETRVRLEGVRTEELEEGLTRCLQHRPTDTHPPPPDAGEGDRAT